MKQRLIATLLQVALCTLGSHAVTSTTWYVNGVSGSDSNDCKSSTAACKTIGHAISLAVSGDSIMIAATTYTEHLSIAVSLKLNGSGATKTIIDGGGFTNVIVIDNTAANVTLSKVTVRNGVSTFGGGIYNQGMLTVTSSTISGNRAVGNIRDQWLAYGGGIYNLGTLTINNSTLNANSASGRTFGSGGAIYNHGALAINNSTLNGNVAAGGEVGRGGGMYIASGTATISNSSFSGNAARIGGGIFNGGTLTISSSTVSGNSAGISNAGGGISNAGGTATLQNSIVANSSSGGNCNGTVTSNGYNLSSDSTCIFTNTGDMNNIEPMLGPLQNNGGPTQTMALLEGSPAIDSGNPTGCTDGLGHLLKTDQRGDLRPNTEDTGGCDRGAYERQSD